MTPRLVAEAQSLLLLSKASEMENPANADLASKPPLSV